MRAVTIQTPNISTGVAGFILPGNKVDVLLTVSTSGASDPTGGGSTMTLLQNVEILAVDQRIEAPQDNKMDPKDLRSVTLLVTPVDAARLDLGQNKGTLHLALRNHADTGTEPVELATLTSLNVGSSEPVVTPMPTAKPEETVRPAPRKKAPLYVRTMRGNRSGFVSFPPAEDNEEEAPANFSSTELAHANESQSAEQPPVPDVP
jgi:pilus assembly protein CpaB